jgi:Ca2+-binding EF-hand superfamily protein
VAPFQISSHGKMHICPEIYSRITGSNDLMKQISQNRTIDPRSMSRKTSRKQLKKSDSSNTNSFNVFSNPNISHKKQVSNVLMQNNTIDSFDVISPKQQHNASGYNFNMTSRPEIAKSTRNQIKKSIRMFRGHPSISIGSNNSGGSGSRLPTGSRKRLTKRRNNQNAQAIDYDKISNSRIPEYESSNIFGIKTNSSPPRGQEYPMKNSKNNVRIGSLEKQKRLPMSMSKDKAYNHRGDSIRTEDVTNKEKEITRLKSEITDTEEKYLTLKKIVETVASKSGFKNEKEFIRTFSHQGQSPVSLNVHSMPDNYSTGQDYTTKPNYANIITINSRSQDTDKDSIMTIKNQETAIKQLEQKVRSYEDKLRQKESHHSQEITLIENRWKDENEQLRAKIIDLELQLKKQATITKISKSDLTSTTAKLVLLTQVFGKIYETILRSNTDSMDYTELTKVLEEYCKISDKNELEKL